MPVCTACVEFETATHWLDSTIVTPVNGSIVSHSVTVKAGQFVLLTCDRSGGRGEVCVGEYEAVSIFTQEPVRTVRSKNQRLCVGQDLV